MIQLLFAVIFSEMVLIVVLLFKSPLRKLLIMGLDQVKRGRGPIMVKTVAGTVIMVLASNVYSMMKIKNGMDEGAINPTDQVLMVNHLLEATLMGAILFLALMIDRLHHYIRELSLKRKNMEAAKKQSLEFDRLNEENRNLQSKLQSLDPNFSYEGGKKDT